MPPQIAVTALDHRPCALLVDRDADTRQMYAEYLRGACCDIDEAEDGREALAKAISRHPDIVITETRLPGMSGVDLTRLLRTDPGTRDIAIVFVTGDAYEIEVNRARAAGADAVLVKPCLPDDLGAMVSKVLAQSIDLRERSRAIQEKIAEQLAKSEHLREQSKRRTLVLSRAHARRDTTDPPTPPPSLVCPTCDNPLQYVKSHVGGVSAKYPEQWDYFECSSGCGTFQYRHRTRKFRRVS